MKHKVKFISFSILFLTLILTVAATLAQGPDDGVDGGTELQRHDPSEAMIIHDAATADVVSGGPSAHVTKNLSHVGRGERKSANSTTDVWALGQYAYTGTFVSPCGGEPDAGIFIWDVHDPNKVTQAGFIPSETGDYTNDVKVASMNSGDILVMSNESCDGGDGGFEIYNVDDPTSPVKLASVTIDELNEVTDFLFGGISNVGVHNLWLFTDGSNDYVAVVAETVFDNFMIFDITNPALPVLASAWGAEEIFDPGVGALTLASPGEPFNGRVGPAIDWLGNGEGAFARRFLHDITISADGTQAYLSYWDAGLVLLDISDPTSPSLVSVALDSVNGSLDGEVNSHAAWPNPDGSIVVESEEDFRAWEGFFPPTFFQFNSKNAIPGVQSGTVTGDAFEFGQQTGNAGTLSTTSLDVTAGPLMGTTFAVAEVRNDAMPLGAGTVSGPIVWIGRACDGDGIANPVAGAIAVARVGGPCANYEKSINAGNAGAIAIVLTNTVTSTPWSGLRIWDYSDPGNPVLASTFNTTCSASTLPGSDCNPAGTFSAHNMVVETKGNKTMAYISWYTDGVLILDVSDPYNPVEVGRFHRAGPDFEAENGGKQDVFGIYKVENSPWIYASDRNGGLYALKEYGSGTGGRK